MSERYIAAAYIVVFLAVLVYLAIIAAKVARLERELGDLARRARGRQAETASEEREVSSVG
ncbi:MAG: CcmD family protein [Actinomycetota bacterium]|nr:CcmD family protein [Actinomycetota bacterium]